MKARARYDYGMGAWVLRGPARLLATLPARLEPRTLVVAEAGRSTVDIITCDSVQEARELVNLACAETVGGCQ